MPLYRRDGRVYAHTIPILTDYVTGEPDVSAEEFGQHELKVDKSQFTTASRLMELI
jgi:hypothetical protein